MSAETKLTGDAYIAVLLERQAEWQASHPMAPSWLVPILEWFVRPGDEDLVSIPKPARQVAKPARRVDVQALRDRRFQAAQRLDSALAALLRAEFMQEEAHRMGGGIPGFGGSGSQRAAQQVRSAMDRAHQAATKAQAQVEKWQYRVTRLDIRIALAEEVAS